MRNRNFVIALGLVIMGCSWTPERSNPFDSGSPVYVDPPIRNRPPEIIGLVVKTNCVNFPTEDQCGVTIQARVTDPDSNLRIGEVIATVDDHYFGRLAFNPVDTLWFLTKQETELDSTAERYVGSKIQVTVSDDSGAVDQDTIRFPQLFRDYPSINWPKTQLDCTCPDFRDFSWNRWTGEGQAAEMEVRFYFGNFDLVPSLTIHNIAPQDTFVTVNRDFEPADSNSTIFYGWRLFVIDQNGNSAGSEPGAFNYRETCNGDCGP